MSIKHLSPLLLALSGALLIILSGLVIEVLADVVSWSFCRLDAGSSAVCEPVHGGPWRAVVGIILFSLLVYLLYKLSSEVIERTWVRGEPEPKHRVADTLVLPLSRIDEPQECAFGSCFQAQYRRKLANVLAGVLTDPHGLKPKRLATDSEIQFDPGAPHNSAGWWRFEHVRWSDYCALDAAELGLTSGRDQFRHFPWQQAFRCVGDLLKESGGRLGTIEIVTSKESYHQVSDFLVMLTALIENETDPAGSPYCVRWENIEGRADDVTEPCVVLRVTSVGVDFEDLGALVCELDAVIGRYRERARRARRKTKPLLPLVIDITGGQKTFSAAAAIKALADDVRFAYVAVHPDDTTDVKVYDIVVERFAAKV